ncbi:MAG: hypothetical protein JW757_00820 [Anaerolineales bacterium]|nr:hypothetical protein [Anaerolineales bacterium]
MAKHKTDYVRYHIHTETANEIKRWPTRFRVKVKKAGLAKWLLKEVLEHGLGNRREVVLSRPCLYGVFSGPVGGFAPRPQHCVGCLRCTTEYPEMVSVTHNPERKKLGDSFFASSFIDALSYESLEGVIPVKGAGYRGKFGGEGWEGMWTDMSEIVRPTRDGIHGREFISTVVDIGYRPNYLQFDEEGHLVGAEPKLISIPLPVLFDVPPKNDQSEKAARIIAKAAAELETLAVLPITMICRIGLVGKHIVPLVKAGEEELLSNLGYIPDLVEMESWDAHLAESILRWYPESILSLRLTFPVREEILDYVQKGISTFHLLADYHGQDVEGNFVLDLIRETHKTLVEAGIRQEVTLVGSGGIITAEHIPKAILCGLDAAAVDTPVMAALQADFIGECKQREFSQFSLPAKLTIEWGVQRLMNLAAAWRDQLLEISGAMGLREIRRMRGEMGRAMFMKELEADAFAGVAGYE